MKPSLMPKQHVAVSFTVLFSLLILISGLALGPPIASRIDFFTRLDALRGIYTRSTTAILTSEATARLFVEWQAKTRTEGLTFRAETIALAAAELQNELKVLIERENGVLESSAFRRRTESLPLAPVTVVVRLRCSVEALPLILVRLQVHEPLLFVERLSIQSRHRPGRSLRASAEELDIELDVTAYLDEETTS